MFNLAAMTLEGLASAGIIILDTAHGLFTGFLDPGGAATARVFDATPYFDQDAIAAAVARHPASRFKAAAQQDEGDSR
jgi:hypothetical protein